MKKQKNIYRVDLRDFSFLLWDQFNVEEEILSLDPSKSISKDIVEDIMKSAKNFAYDFLGPYYQSWDREGCQLEAGNRIRLPQDFEYVWQQFMKAEWGKLAIPQEYGGAGAPYIVVQMVNEIFFGANPSFPNYYGFCIPAVQLILEYGSEFLKKLFCDKLISTQWTAAFCMTESDAGTDVGNIRTTAEVINNNIYQIHGNKIFISAGMHELTENIVYIVLARAKDSPPGTSGLSAFIVPKYWVDEEGSLAAFNNVTCVGIEEKMGLHGCCTAQLSFGGDGPCYGYLLGERENVGLLQILTIMNQARIATGIFSLGLASSAYLNAAEYAQERIQGTDIKQSFNPKAKRVEIIHHGDIKRMLLEMKSKVEGCRALMAKLTYHYSLYMYYQSMPIDEKQATASIHKNMVDLLIPIVKSYTSDQAWRICELAIQTLGGYGYTKDYPVEQYARDVKIMSIWEGTNYIQSVDLVRAKLKLCKDTITINALFDEITGFIDKSIEQNTLQNELETLSNALDILKQTYAYLRKFGTKDGINYLFTVSTRFLEMMAEVIVSWLLLDAALIAHKKLNDNELNDANRDFYNGKIVSAKFYIHNILPGVMMKSTVIYNEDRSVLESTPEMFMIV